VGVRGPLEGERLADDRRDPAGHLGQGTRGELFVISGPVLDLLNALQGDPAAPGLIRGTRRGVAQLARLAGLLAVDAVGNQDAPAA
jgi:hypothetical protein